jgi:hypothetical protein
LKPTFRTLFLLVLPLLLSTTALAQTHRASVRGTIAFPNRGVLPGVKVTLTRVDTGESRIVESGEQGEYAFTSLPPGLYDLKVSVQRFHEQRRITLLVNEVRREDVEVAVSGPEELVTVDTTFDAHMKKDSASLGTRSLACRWTGATSTN